MFFNVVKNVKLPVLCLETLTQLLLVYYLLFYKRITSEKIFKAWPKKREKINFLFRNNL